ncbi:hypothetical protein TNIN_448021 [Trichonephila inaurata madagascariensis]|uniref:DUF19 domain-containing protein n=1 Tax=Trichonephila inaurata madagascariensis TaxID=2747483 RepID=A0A8X7BNR0_9ARAC|nr:hypothetical protein TNIN_448021 [Trichonephila inaurata madagascariensis]
MLLLNLILLVLLHVVLPGASGILEDFEESCENPLRCPFDLDFFRKPPFSQSELNAFCLEVVSYFECLDYARSHFEQEKECELAKLMSRAETFLKTSCFSKEFRNQYLEHAKCYRKIDISIECDKYALNRMKLYDVATPDPKLPEHSIKGVRKCMAASLKANCFGIRIYEECGEEAEQMFYKIFNGTQLYSQYCPGFTHALARKRSEAILKTIDTLLIEY